MGNTELPGYLTNMFSSEKPKSDLAHFCIRKDAISIVFPTMSAKPVTTSDQ